MASGELLNIADHYVGDRLREGRGDRIALRLDDGTRSYADVERLASRFGNALRALGVRPEERVVVALPDGEAYVGAIFGILKLGAVVVMVNPGLPVDTLQAILDHGRVAVVVVAASALPTVEPAAAGTRHTPPTLLVVDGDAGPHTAFDALDASDELDTVPTHRDDPAIWLFSGGTTGRPKAVVQTHGSYANAAERYGRQAMGYREDDIAIGVPKLYFGYAMGAVLFFPFAVGGSAVLFAEHPTPDVLFNRIERHRPTILVNVPSMIAKLLDHPQATRRDLSSLRFATSAGEALPVALYERWMSTYGVELYDGLGTAEMWHIFLSNRPGRVRPGTLGTAVPGYEVRVRDEHGADLPAGEVGHLWVRGGSRAIAYWRNMPETQRVFRGEWVVTGDLISADADGYVTYVGRGDDALKVKGRWLLPAEVESCILDHPLVSECAVVGVTDADGLTKPVAFVVAPASGPHLEAELQRFVLDRLEPYKHPRRIEVLDDLPRTHLGKVDRTALRRRAQGSDGPG
jgi:benzoate-CoA ligase family protein